MLKQHPRGLAVIFFTEMWERIGFYTLMAILVLYMDKEFSGPTSAKPTSTASSWLVLFHPVTGGLARRPGAGTVRTIRIGAVLMACGYVALALSSQQRLWPFYAGLLLIALGTGIFKVNMSVTLGQLYADRPELKDTGFNIYYMASTWAP